MNNFKKLAGTIALLVMAQSAANAAVLTVTDPYYEAPGGFLDVLNQAQAGDTITFDSSFDGYFVHYYEAITIDKAVKIDASGMAYGLIFNQFIASFLNPGFLNIDTAGDTRAVTIINASFSDLEEGAPVRVSNSHFICKACRFNNNRNFAGRPESSAMIVSTDANVALLNSSFYGNNGDQGALYYGSGNLYMVNTFASENFVDYPYTSALFEGTGQNQLFYVRNSTFANNQGHVFKMNTDAGSKLDIRHTIVASNTPFYDPSAYQIEANIVSRGYNILNGISSQSNYLPRSSDSVDVNSLDVFADTDGDNEFTPWDVSFGANPPALLFFTLNPTGLAFNKGDPLYNPYELLWDYRKIPASFIVPMINALREGDQLRGIQPRVSGGRIDIGAYEMPLSN